MKEFVVSLRRDMSHVLWSGLRLQDGVDLEFRMQRYSEHLRRILARLVKGDEFVDLVTGSLIEMSDLGADYEHLESIESELAVICKLAWDVHASMDGAGVLLRINVQDTDQQFMLYAKQEGRPFVERFDWFVSPYTPSFDSAPIHEGRPVSQLFHQENSAS